MSAHKKTSEPPMAYVMVEPGMGSQHHQQPIPQPASADFNRADHELPKLGSKRQVRGAAVAGGLTGLVLVGPAAGLLAAGGAALATGGKGDIGKAARAAGDSISDLGKSLKKFDEKHDIKKKTTKGIVKGCDWVSKRLSQEKGSIQ